MILNMHVTEKIISFNPSTKKCPFIAAIKLIAAIQLKYC